MNKRYKKMLATGLALNMMLINIPYNVFANSDIIENVVLSEDNIPLIGEQSKSDLDNLINQDEQILNNEDLIMKESDSNHINNEISSELLEPVIQEDYSTITEVSINENISNSVTDFTEDKKIVKSTIPGVTNYADSFAGGDGTEENPYQISNALELARLAYLVNEEGLDTANIYFELIDDIDLEGFDVDNDDTNGNWIPIGVDPYTIEEINIVLNGNNYTISNMIVNYKQSYSGLFGVLNNLTATNLKFENCHIFNSQYSGVLVGLVNNILDLNNIEGNNNSIEFTEENRGGFAGGLVGMVNIPTNKTSNLKAEKINFQIDINCPDDINNYVSGAGGLIGSSRGAINVLLNEIKIDTSFNGNFNDMGGIIGSQLFDNNKNEASFKNVTINVDFNTENTSVICNVGALIGLTYDSSYNSTTINAQNINVFINNNISETIRIDMFGGLIGKTSNIDLIAKNINIKSNNSFNGSITGGLVGETYNSELDIENIDIKVNIFAIYYGGGLIGKVDGNSHGFSINNVKYEGILSSEESHYCNLGGIIGSSSIGYFKISNSDIKANILNSNLSGGIVANLGIYAKNESLIEKNTVKVSIENSKYQTGGLIGFLSNRGKLNIYENEVYVNIDCNKYDTSFIGGIVGQIYNEYEMNINNNFAIGSINSPTIKKGYLAGTISNDTNLSTSNMYFVLNIENNFPVESNDTNLYSSITGDGYAFDNIYYDKKISNLKDDLAIGLSTEEMQGINAKENMPFDYDNVWKLNKEYYPTFEQLNTSPELSGNDIELVLNQDYNLLDYVTVEDFEDKDLIPEIVTDLDITKIGEYTATFIVTDPEGLSDELTLNIKVVMENPIINASNIEIYKGEKFDPRKDVTAIDVDGTDITEHIKIIENTVNTQEVGEYKVVYEVSSLYKSTIQKEVKVTVKEKQVVDEEEKPDIPNPDKDEKPNNSKPEEDKDKDKKPSNNTNKPQTGDNIMIYGLSLMMSLAGLFSTNRKNKYK